MPSHHKGDHPWDEHGRKRKKRMPNMEDMGKEHVKLEDGALVGYGAHLKQRIGSLKRYVVVALDPEAEVSVVVRQRFPEGVVERTVPVGKT